MNKTELLIVIFGTLTVFLTSIEPLRKLFLSFLQRTKFQSLGSSSKMRVIHQLNDSIKELANNRTGAIITIEFKQNLDNLRTDGILLDANLSSFLILSIFNKYSPLHDGAIIIQGSKIRYAGTFYRITEQSVNNKYGSRHRAAIGISEQSDSLTIVVSEETGEISFVKEGKIIPIPKNEFQNTLTMYLK